jgi:hypothetical protein
MLNIRYGVPIDIRLNFARNDHLHFSKLAVIS